MNSMDNLKMVSGKYMKELAEICDLDPRVMENFEKNDNLLFTTIVPFLDAPIFNDFSAQVDSYRFCHAVEKYVKGRIYYGFSVGKNMVVLFVDGDPETWDRDLPRKGKALRAAIGKSNSAKFMIGEVMPSSYKGVLIFKAPGQEKT